MTERAPAIFTIPARAPFLATLAARLLAGDIVKGFRDPADPLGVARATVLVPTRRAAQELRAELLAAGGGAAIALPTIMALGDFERAESPLLGDGSDLGPPDAVGELARRMALAKLIRAWSLGLDKALVTEDGKPAAPVIVASSPASAFALAGALGALIDEMTIEGVDWRKLDKIVPDRFDRYWEITLRFLRIAAEAWPKWLAERGLIDQVARGARLIAAEIAKRDAPGAGPMILAGSTGTNRATALLMAALARAPLGAVVLPDLDPHLDEASVAQILAEDKTPAAAAGHPQAALLRLLKDMKVDPRAVRALEPAGGGAPAARARLLSEAMRPSETTDLWALRGEALTNGETRDALAGVTLIEAENEAEESLAIALVLREALETPGKRAALVTPDANLSRRVVADLARFGVVVDDFAGASLARAELGAFARLALAAAVAQTPANLAALIGHPLFRPVGIAVEGARRALDLGVFRRPETAVKGALAAEAIAAARLAAEGKHAHPALAALSGPMWDEAAALTARLGAAFAGFSALGRSGPLHDFLGLHRTLVWSLGGLDDARPTEAQEPLAQLFATWAEAATDSFACAPEDYVALFDEALRAIRWSPERAAHPRIAALGLLEARLLRFDRIVLGGLDEGTWPPAASLDPFLNRAMRADLGLSSPERRIGQTAHDFTSALGAKEAVLTRSAKRGRAPTLPSRFLLRLRAVAGEAMREVKARGDRHLSFARALDAPEKPRFIDPPRPKPPVALRPTRFSVTRVETLRRDPYAVYASDILKLRPLDPIGVTPGPREIGTAWHEALQAYVNVGAADEAGRAFLHESLRRAFAPFTPEQEFAWLRWPELERAAAFFLATDATWRSSAAARLTEVRGDLTLTTPQGREFTLTARADRIDRLKDGGLRLIDYKTGAPPSVGAVIAGLAPQMTLEAALALAGGFAGIAQSGGVSAIYLKIGGSEGGSARDALGKKRDDLASLAAAHLAALKDLVDHYADPETPYLAHRHPVKGRIGDFDALARVAEWSATGGQDDEDDGAEGGDA